MDNITSTMDVITCKQTENIWRNIMTNTNTLVDAIAADERGAAALEVSKRAAHVRAYLLSMHGAHI
jgi:hypothetical protein